MYVYFGSIVNNRPQTDFVMTRLQGRAHVGKLGTDANTATIYRFMIKKKFYLNYSEIFVFLSNKKNSRETKTKKKKNSYEPG